MLFFNTLRPNADIDYAYPLYALIYGRPTDVQYYKVIQLPD